MDSLILAGGAGLATALVVGLGVHAAGKSAAAEHPTGSEADDGMRTATWVGNGLAIAGIVGGIGAALSGHKELGTLLLGAGAGSFVGSSIAKRSFEGTHGVGVETTIRRVLDDYDDNDDGLIDMNANSFWRGTETERTVSRQHTDSFGNTYYDSDTFSIARLASLADVDRTGVATQQELRTLISSYDADGNGRLQGAEQARYKGEAGEVQTR